MAKPNYSFEKRQRELAKQKKKDEKDAKKRAERECPSLELADGDGDGVLDTALGLVSADQLCLDVVAARNATVPARERPLLFRASLELSGDRVARLSARRTIYFLVPRTLGAPR